jgi:very-short-patch-repair endonuclease
MALINCQYSKTLTEIYKIAGFTPGTGSRIAGECVKKNLLKIIRIPFGKGKPSYPVLTPESYQILNVNEKKFSGRGAGYEHTLYQHLIAEYFSDYKPIIELNRNNHFIDVVIETNEKLICIEVAMTSVHERENIEKDFLLAKADSVIIACINDKVQKEIEDILIEIPEQIRNKTEVMLISELLKKNPEELLQIKQFNMNFKDGDKNEYTSKY